MVIRSQIEHAAELTQYRLASPQSTTEQRATSSSFDADILWLTFLSVSCSPGRLFTVFTTQPIHCDSSFLQDSLIFRGSANLPYLWHWLMETYSTSVALAQFLSHFTFVKLSQSLLFFKTRQVCEYLKIKKSTNTPLPEQNTMISQLHGTPENSQNEPLKASLAGNVSDNTFR